MTARPQRTPIFTRVSQPRRRAPQLAAVLLALLSLAVAAALVLGLVG